MISRNIFTDVLMIVLLAALQIYVMNNITLFGKYSPVIYPVFVMFYPFFRNQYVFLTSSFLLGLIIDIILGTWGINAFATTAIAYFRTLIFKSSTDSDTDFFTFHNLQWSQFLLFIFSSIFVHQFLVQLLEFFKLNELIEVFLNIIVTSLISFIVILIYALLFKIKQKN